MSNYFELMKTKMENQYGPQALFNPHPGFNGNHLTGPQTWASINPEFQHPERYAHIIKPYDQPITIQEEPFKTANEDVDMEVVEN